MTKTLPATLFNLNGFVLFSHSQLAALLMSLFTLPQLFLPLLLTAATYSVLRFNYERRNWNGGMSPYGTRWKARPHSVLFGYRYQEAITSAPRAGDIIVVNHFRPAQTGWKLA